ncbi:hypothetical protein ES705_18741 [subsurface metagenome]
MGLNALEIYRKKKATIICTVDLSKSELTSLEGYTSTLTVKVNKDDETAVITSEGEIIDLVIIFVLTLTETDKVDNIYNYDIVITKPPVGEEDPLVHTVTQDVFEIKKSVSN